MFAMLRPIQYREKGQQCTCNKVPVHVDVCEPILNHYDHMTHCEEEGRHLKRLRMHGKQRQRELMKYILYTVFNYFGDLASLQHKPIFNRLMTNA